MDIGLTIALIGIASSAIGSTLVYWRQKNETRTVSGKKLLYHSLELRYWLQNEFVKIGAHTKPLYDYYISKFQEKGYAVQDIDIKPFTDWATTSLVSIIDQHPVKVTDSFLQSYKSTLLDFSTISPIIAYRQEGYDGLHRQISFIKEYKAKCETEIVSQLKGVEGYNQLFTILETEFSKYEREILDDFDKELFRIAKFCGFRVKKELKQLLKKKNHTELSPEIKESLNALVDQVDELIKSNNQSAPNMPTTPKETSKE